MGLKHKTLQIMHPGCQDLLLHSILPGTEDQDGIRINYSFRRCFPPKQNNDPSHACPNTAQKMSSSPVPPIKMEKRTLILGTSITKPLNATRLQKGGNTCINLSQGGAKIQDLKKNLLTFKDSDDANNTIDKVILSVGTNDVRNLKEGKDVDRLLEPLEDLIKTVKVCYPKAELYMQSMLPIKLNRAQCHENKITVDKCYSYNRLSFNLCKKYNIYYIDMFKNFLTTGRPSYREVREDLYKDQVHLSNKGIGIIARRFIYIINKDSLGFHPSKF